MNRKSSGAGQTLFSAIQDNNAKLPVLRAETGWLQNLTVTAVNHMLASGMTQEMFFCPSNKTHQKSAMIVWLHHLTENPQEYDRYWDGRIAMGGLVRSGVYDTTSHLKNDEEPSGFNVGFLDGHVVWRTWNPPRMPEVDENGNLIPRWPGHGPDCFW